MNVFIDCVLFPRVLSRRIGMFKISILVFFIVFDFYFYFFIMVSIYIILIKGKKMKD